MDAGHAHLLYRHGDTVVHRLPAHTKLVATVAFVLAVVLTPRDRFWAFGVDALLLAAAVAGARIPPGVVARRALVEVPFVFFALLLPFIATGQRVDVLGVSVSEDGLLGAWNILAKSTLGVIASVVLAATTDLPDLLAALQRLRMPTLLVQITAFMLRYLHVVTAEMGRMRVARESRAFVARDARALPVLAQSAQALFVRSYERGERVHLAMLSRGYDGAMPLADRPASAAEWARAMTVPVAAALVALVAVAL
ncbi:energy-coupling factor transporter transmembrane component T family protein [Jatrophihabitans fulvus]